MGCTIDVPDKAGGTCSDAYFIAKSAPDNETKGGVLEIPFWKSRALYKSGAKKINNISIPIRDSAETKDGDDVILSLNLADFIWKNGSDVYTKIKTLKVRSLGQIVDLSNAQDVLED